MTGGAAAVAARITGDVRGQVAVGNNIVQYNVDHGGVVWAADPAGLPRPRLRGRVQVRGRRPQLVGRQPELRAVTEALAPATPVELSGPAGIGKTVLLKHLAHNLPAGTVAVVYHDARGEPAEDVLQFLYDAFYETGVPFKPTPGQLREALADVAGLVALDDLTLDRAALESVLDAVPGATFVLATEDRRLWGQGRSFPVQGLPTDASVALLERELGRAVAGEERASAEEACRALDGSPLRVVQLAALVRDLGGATADAAALVGGPGAGERLAERLRSSLASEQLRVLGILESVLGASLSARHLAGIAGVPDIEAVVEPLLRAGLVQAHSPRYSVRPARPERSPDRSARPSPVADYLTALGEADVEPDRLAEEAAAIVGSVAQARERRDWTTVLRLGRAAERALAVSRRWGAWEILLRHQLEAARALGDRRAEAWALHQLGTRALCLDDPLAARDHLAQALAIRSALGDEAGSAATRHNLEHLGGPPPAPPDRGGPTTPPDGPPPGWPTRPWVLAAIAVAAAFMFIAGVTVASGRGDQRPTGELVHIKATGYSLTVEPAEVDFGPATVGTASPTRRVTIVNTGSSPLRLGPASNTDAAADFVVAEDACARSDLPPGGRCDMEVAFRPTTTGTREATVEMPLPDRMLSVTLRGRGVRDPAPTPPSVAVTEPTVPAITLPPAVATSTTMPGRADLSVDLRTELCGLLAGVCPAPGVTSGCGGAAACAVVTNHGPSTANGVRLDVVGQNGWVAGCGDNFSPQCRWPSLASGQSVTVEISADVDEPGGGSPSIRVSVTGDETDLEPANNSETFPPPAGVPA